MNTVTNCHFRSMQAIRLTKAFQTKYEGQAVDSLLSGLTSYEKIYNPDTYYGRTIAIIQSSATGKSRLIQELLTKVNGV